MKKILLWIILSLILCSTVLGLGLIDDNLAYLKLEESSGDYNNEVPGQNNGTRTNTPDRITGKIDYGQKFVATSSEKIDWDSGVNPTSFSYNLWINLSSADSFYFGEFDSFSWGNIDYYSWTSTDGRISTQMGYGAGADHTDMACVAGSMPSNKWGMFTFTYNDTDRAMKLYSNATLCDSDILGGVPKATSTVVSLGRLTSYYNGQIDEYAYWDRALSPSEIIELYNDNNPGTSQQYDYTPPVSYPAIDNSTWNMTVAYYVANQTAWRTDQSFAISTEDNLITVKFNTTENAYCRIGREDHNWTTMTGLRNCTTTGTTSQICTQANVDALSPLARYNSVYIACIDSTFTYEDDVSLSGVLNVSLELPPTIIWNAPANNTDTSDSIIWAQITVTDEVYSTTDCSYYINGTLYNNNVSVLNNTLTNFTSTSLSDGNYNHWIVCNNTLGKEDTSSNYTISIDNTPPELSIQSPASNVSYIVETNITFSYTANDTNFNNCSLYVNSTLNSSNTTEGSSTMIAGFGAGSWEWYITCYDDIGNMNTSNTYNIIVDEVTAVHLFVEGYNTSKKFELMTTPEIIINLSSTLGLNPSVYVCLGIDLKDYGDNVSCGMTPFSYNWTIPNVEETTLLTNSTTGSFKRCTQETANASTVDDTTSCTQNYTGGTYSYNGSVTDFANMFDTDYTTVGKLNSRNSRFFVNYTKPKDIISTETLWRVKDELGQEDVYINSSCWNDATYLILSSVRGGDNDIDGPNYISWECFDGTKWITSLNRTVPFVIGEKVIYSRINTSNDPDPRALGVGGTGYGIGYRYYDQPIAHHLVHAENISVTESFKISGVKPFIRNKGDPGAGNLVLDFREDNGTGYPTNETILTATIPLASMTNMQNYSVYFNATYDMIANTNYWLVYRSSLGLTATNDTLIGAECFLTTPNKFAYDRLDNINESSSCELVVALLNNSKYGTLDTNITEESMRWAINITNNTIVFGLYNWSTILNGSFDLSGSESPQDVRVDIAGNGDTDFTLRGELEGKNLIETRYSTDDKTENWNFFGNRILVKYINLSNFIDIIEDITMTINASASNPEGIDYTAYWFNTSDWDTTGSEDGATPTCMFDDITTSVSGRWNFDTGGGATAEFDSANERVYTQSAAAVSCGSGSTSISESAFLNTKNLNMPSQSKRWDFDYSCSVSATGNSIGDTNGDGQGKCLISIVDNSEGSGGTDLLNCWCHSTYCYEDCQRDCGGSSSCSSSMSGTLSLREKSNGDIEVYEDSSYIKTITPSSKTDMEIKMLTSGDASCSGSIGSSGSGVATGIFNDIEIGGFGNNYSEAGDTYTTGNYMLVSDIILNTSNQSDSTLYIQNAIVNFTELQPDGCDIRVYLNTNTSNDNGWQEFSNGLYTDFTSPGSNLTYKITLNVTSTNNLDVCALTKLNILISTLHTNNISIYLGEGNIPSYSYTDGELNESNTPLVVTLNYSSANIYLDGDTCQDTGSTCLVPIKIITKEGTAGNLKIGNISFNQTLDDINFPIDDLVEEQASYTGDITQKQNITNYIYHRDGTIIVSDLAIRILSDDNITLTATAYNSTGLSDSIEILGRYTPFNLIFTNPLIEDLFFNPWSNNIKNVTPYGQYIGRYLNRSLQNVSNTAALHNMDLYISTNSTDELWDSSRGTNYTQLYIMNQTDKHTSSNVSLNTSRQLFVSDRTNSTASSIYYLLDLYNVTSIPYLDWWNWWESYCSDEGDGYGACVVID